MKAIHSTGYHQTPTQRRDNAIKHCQEKIKHYQQLLNVLRKEQHDA
jgi:hypothetical protein